MSAANDKIEPTVTVIFERKKSDGNYGSGSCTIMLCGVPIGASQELLEAMAKTADDATAVARRLALAGVKDHALAAGH
jgi:hypothetical protein